MKRLYTLLLILLITFVGFVGTAHSEDASSAMQRIGQEVAELNLGFGNYILGQQLTAEQQDLAKTNKIAKSVPGTIKFQDDGIFVIVQSTNSMVLGIYKQYENTARQEVKNIVGELMMRFNEPTTMAHDKLIYWAFSKDGHLAQDEYDFMKQAGDTNIIATVKFSSTSTIFPDPDPAAKTDKKAEQEQKADIYVMITSNPLSKIFLAQNE